MRYTSICVVVHLPRLCGPLSFTKKLKKHNKNSCEKNLRLTKEIMKFTWMSDAVRFFVRCSAVFSRMKYPRRFGCREKQSRRISVKSKLLLNRNELERVFYMKKLRLVDIFPTAYNLNHSDERFVIISQKRPLPLIVSHTVFKINFKP